LTTWWWRVVHRALEGKAAVLAVAALEDLELGLLYQ
jgi:hypothetical protein